MPGKNYICKDQDGNILVSIEKMSEEELSDSPLFTHCLAVVKVGNEYLLGRNKWRNRYEIFGGCREKGESSRDCILRECNEEFGFASADIISVCVHPAARTDQIGISSFRNGCHTFAPFGENRPADIHA